MKKIALAGLLALPLFAHAAQSVDLQDKSAAYFHKLMMPSTATQQVGFKTTSTSVDANQIKHTRIQETYAGYPVYGADVTMHQSQNQSHLNGVVYQNLAQDLKNTPAAVFAAAQAQKALAQAKQLYQKKVGRTTAVTQPKTKLVVYIDANKKAHWAFVVSFIVHGRTAIPTYILDAESFTVYKQWNNLQTLEYTTAGGFGGNVKMGKLVYDSLPNDLPAMTMERDSTNNTCYVENDDVTVLDMNKDLNNPPIAQFPCEATDAQHGTIYWDGERDAVNGAYSPINDALYAGKIIKEMYQNWYHVPVLINNGRPMMLVMRVHARYEDGAALENAYWDGQSMTFGDGEDYFYPLVSLGVAAHEISHGFTEQHSGLIYASESGGLNESFSDMAAQAAEYYSYGKSSWQIGGEIVKNQGEALRYMDEPTRDGFSISDVRDFDDDLDVHQTSGIFNKAYYLLSNSKDWNAKKAFDVMVHANMYYWTSMSTFEAAACGVRRSAHDYKYDIHSVDLAMAGVGIAVNDHNCPI